MHPVAQGYCFALKIFCEMQIITALQIHFLDWATKLRKTNLFWVKMKQKSKNKGGEGGGSKAINFKKKL